MPKKSQVRCNPLKWRKNGKGKGFDYFNEYIGIIACVLALARQKDGHGAYIKVIIYLTLVNCYVIIDVY